MASSGFFLWFLASNSLIMKYPVMGFFSFKPVVCIVLPLSLLGFCWGYWFCQFMPFTKFGKFSAIIFASILSFPLFHLSFWDFNYFMLNFLILPLGPWEYATPFPPFILHLLFILNNFYWSLISQILSSVISILLLAHPLYFQYHIFQL